MAEKKTTKSKASAEPKVATEALNRVAAEIASRRRPMTLAEILELTEQ